MTRTSMTTLIALLSLTSCAPPGRVDAEPPSRVHDASGDGETVRITTDASHGFVARGVPNRLQYLITLDAAKSTITDGPPLNVSLVIDKSGSMNAHGKIGYALDTAEGVIDRLDDRDVLSVIAYDDSVHTLVPAGRVHERAASRRVVRRIAPGGNTNLYAGLTAGYEHVRTYYDECGLNRVILLSDGLANTGIADPHAIWKQAEWMRRHGVRVTTIGLGVDYDEVLMSNIAERSGGNYYYVRHPRALAEIFAAELDEMNGTVARDVTVTVELAAGTSLERVHGYPFEIVGSTVRIDVSDLEGGETRKILLELEGRASHAGQVDVASSRVHYHDVARERRAGARTAMLTATTTTDLELVERTRNPVVLEKRILVENALAQQRAIEALKDGRPDDARRQVSERVAASRRLNERGLSSDDVARQLDAMEAFVAGMDSTEGDHAGRRDLEILGQLRALGYIK